MRKSLLAEPGLPGRLLALLPGTSGGSAPDRGQPAPVTRRAPSGPAGQLALNEVRGNLTITDSTITVWFTLRKQVWPFRSDGAREAAIAAAAGQYAGLAGHSLHVRRTSIPFPVHTWARGLHENSRPLPDSVRHVTAAAVPHVNQWAGTLPAGRGDEAFERTVPIAHPPTWAQHLGNAVAHLERGGYSEGRTHLGVAFPRPASLIGRSRDADAAIAALADDIARVTEELAAPGLAARPATPAEMLWLIYRSAAMGLTPPAHRPADITADDIAEFTEGIELRRGAYDATTQITDRSTGQTVHVAVLTMGRMEPLVIPQFHPPWLHLSAELGFQVEVSSRVLVLGPQAARAVLHPQLQKIRGQQLDYIDHNEDVPLELDRLAQRGLEIEHVLDTALPATATRVHGYHRFAVYGDTPEQALERARELTRVYDSALKAKLVHTKRQYDLMREFIPGERTVDVGYLRRQPVAMFAAAVPQATAGVGDNRGDLIGHTATSGTLPVLFDPNFPMEIRERSGLAVFAAEPGGGKSTLMATLGYLNARRGTQVTLMDPSGPLARLAGMPELRDFSRVVDLVGAQAGTLAPYAMIPTPARSEFPPGPAGDQQHADEVELAQAERSTLVLDILQMILPATAVEDAATVRALREAVRRVPREETSTLDDVVAQLTLIGQDPASRVADTATDLAGLLSDMVSMPLARLFFGRPPAGILKTDAALTVITMNGLRLPKAGSDRRYWDTREQLAVPLLHLANLLAVRRCYGGSMTSRKMVGLDEAHFMNQWESGKQFLIRLARDSRKWNLAALVASQNPRDILELGVQNLVSTVFVGRIADDPEIAAEALRLLRVPVGAGYEATLAGLSQVADTDSAARLGYREFVMRDVDGRVQKIVIDVSWIPGLLDTLDTTPGVLTGRTIKENDR